MCLLDKLKMMGYNVAFENDYISLVNNSKNLKFIGEDINATMERRNSLDYQIMICNNNIVVVPEYQYNANDNRVIAILDSKYIIDCEGEHKEFIQNLKSIPVAIDKDKIYKYLTCKADNAKYSHGIRLTNTILLMGDHIINFMRGSVHKISWVATCGKYLALVISKNGNAFAEDAFLIDSFGNLYIGKFLRSSGDTISGTFNSISKKDNSYEDEHFEVDAEFLIPQYMVSKFEKVGDIVW